MAAITPVEEREQLAGIRLQQEARVSTATTALWNRRRNFRYLS